MDNGALVRRLRLLPTVIVLDREVPVATGIRPRLMGLACIDREEAGGGLLIPRCSSVHTFGMRFALDLVFLDAHGETISIRSGVPPRRFAWERGAAAVLELPAFGELQPLGPAKSVEKGGEFSRLIS
jgi:uncharacterized protein